jgi:AraC family transcriptional regulator, exoenzyme S synthesis regulatory protein ExsA
MSTAATRTPDYVIGEISPEQFIAEHSFLFIIKGIMRCYDGSKSCVFRSGDYGLLRKNRLGRYKKEKEDGELEKVFVFFDEKFLRMFQQKHHSKPTEYRSTDTMVPIRRSDLVPNFIQSLLPYYGGGGRIDPAFADIKKEELLVILLRNQPELAGVFFDFGAPQKINLEEFMNRNFKFNVSLQRFAYLTGRSLSAFKRDFKAIFHETPNRWLVRKRLQEAYFLIEKSKKKPSDIYLDLGFEDLSHFSFAFKKLFGLAPTDLAGPKKGNAR